IVPLSIWRICSKQSPWWIFPNSREAGEGSSMGSVEVVMTRFLMREAKVAGELQYGTTGEGRARLRSTPSGSPKEMDDEICRMQRNVRRQAVCRHVFHPPRARLHRRRDRAVHARF